MIKCIIFISAEYYLFARDFTKHNFVNPAYIIIAASDDAESLSEIDFACQLKKYFVYHNLKTGQKNFQVKIKNYYLFL